ncbi:NAD-dependent epimerase/dehydratase family protein [Singulisphaera acidiphila]|uniref:Nucleoside-diphosphate-sugar epimerase n=1 Tax=Singulisphaera acidiphila (strain ATCC BAA-1392 / DSM 18658 / VKM B-2454 / MOB10) TaxID=886293 RepID=L0DJ02_SINAD|nr:NAD-dependent epimerase/dehydratase family protein [Singulisphaera acidiphila]AGA28641.1 nucleoside-diphosphate-sugar epimerase [Singulisphaera acidiphila DSM 18658]
MDRRTELVEASEPAVPDQAVTASSSREKRTVLVTGAGGFVGGHVARKLAAAGYRVRGLVRRKPRVDPEDPSVDWIFGDLCDPEVRTRAVEGAWGVAHCGGWVNLASDPDGEARAVNVEATRGLLAACAAAGVERFVYTSTLHTLAAGSAECPADEETPWNLERVRSPYLESKREAERDVLAGQGGRLSTLVLCPGMVIGPRDARPTSTKVLFEMAKTPVAFLPAGGIPVIDAHVLALAHQRALESLESGRRFALVGPYMSYREQAELVAELTGRPRWCVPIADGWERPLSGIAGCVDRLVRGRGVTLSAAAVAGGFLRLHVKGDRADAAFGLRHPPPIQSIYQALADFQRTGRAPWLKFRKGVESQALDLGAADVVAR